MKERELKLSLQLIELQAQYNEMTIAKDVWRRRCHDETKEKVELASKVRKAIYLLDSNGIKHDITELPF